MSAKPALIFVFLYAAARSIAAEIEIDFSHPIGSIRPLHGVNLGPLCYRGLVDLSRYHRELNLPLTRLHDVVWVNYDAVDISTIFRDFRNDPGAADSYEFAPTDDYLAAIVKAGSPILYRLGESIEHTPRKYRVNPPKDFAKWAEICCRIIRHYNEGWSGGFHYNIRYWEIWNEPENQPAMWTGTDDQYFQLYEVTAKAIKSSWPQLKVGGPSLGYTGEFKEGRFQPGAFLEHFLRYCREHEAPLDFFSWHLYTQDPSDYARRARVIRRLLDEQGFSKTESHCNEWNFLPNNDWHPLTKEGQGLIRQKWSAEMGGPRGAAFAAWVLMSLQDAPVNMANYYTAEIQMFGLFDFDGVPRKTFYAFKTFRELLTTPRRVQTPAFGPGQVAVCAGLNPVKSRAAILLSNYYPPENPVEVVVRKLPWTSATQFKRYVTDATHDNEMAQRGTLGPEGRLGLPESKTPAVVLWELAPVESTQR